MKQYFFTVFLFLAQVAQGASLPISVGGDLNIQNQPFVSVTICEPGKNHCQTIPDILLDTGSSGLRIFKSAFSLNLPQEMASKGGVAECAQFAGGAGPVLWGPVGLVDVVLGGVRARNVPIHVVDRGYASIPTDCGSNAVSDPNSFGANGILGISPASTDCDGETCPGENGGKLYYSCSGSNCQSISPEVAQQIQNPVRLMPEGYNNGISVSFPPVTGPQLQGTLTLGIEADTSDVKTYATDKDGILKARFQGKDYWSKFDTGTAFWSLPVNDGIPDCSRSGNAAGYLCPSSPVALSFAAVGRDGFVGPSVDFQVGNAESEFSSSYFAVSDVAYDDVVPQSFLISLPFFFGRTVYVGIDGQSSALGQGPYYAY